MNEERPIVFTVSQNGNGNFYSITSKDSRNINGQGHPFKFTTLSSTDIYRIMRQISGVLNDNGYAVLFEVDWYVINA